MDAPWPTPRQPPPRKNAASNEPALHPAPFEGVDSRWTARIYVAPRPAPPLSSHRLAAITCYFNPCGYDALRRNYRRFVGLIREQRIPLFSIELAFGDAPFFLTSEEATLQLRCHDVMWQKERLLNVLLDRLPTEFTHIAWLDADLHFGNANWAVEASRLLESFPVVQLFENAAFLDRNGNVEDIRDGIALAQTTGAPHAQHFGVAHPGFAWAARRELLDAHGLLDQHIAGGGDSLMAMAMFGWWDHSYLRVYNRGMHEAWLDWAQPFHDDVRGRVGYVRGTVYHFWHGSRTNRRYNERVACLSRHDFDPRVDLELDENSVWRWATNKPQLHSEIRQYFFERREDE